MTRKGPKPKPVPERFWPKVKVIQDETSCWEWQGAINEEGYGKFGMPGSPGGWVLAHRIAWELQTGPITPEQCVLHKCDNRKCQRVSHLFLGDRTMNSVDMVKKGRNAIIKGSRHGRAKLTEKHVREMRRRWGKGESTQSLALRFGVSEASVYNVTHRISWRHVM